MYVLAFCLGQFSGPQILTDIMLPPYPPHPYNSIQALYDNFCACIKYNNIENLSGFFLCGVKSLFNNMMSI